MRPTLSCGALLLALGVAAMAGCSEDSANASDGTTDDVADCSPPGALWCGCGDGMICGGGMACVEGECTGTVLPAPGPPPERDFPVPSSETPCTTDDECSGVEVCEASECTHAWNVPWLLTGATSNPLECGPSIDPALGYLDVIYYHGSPITQRHYEYWTTFPTTGGCPFVWSGFVLELPPFAETWPEVAVLSQLGDETDRPGSVVGRWCWDSLHDGECGPIPAEFLVAGQLDAPELHMEFARASVE